MHVLSTVVVWKMVTKTLLSDCKECSCLEKSPVMLNFCSSLDTSGHGRKSNLRSHLCAARKAGESTLSPLSGTMNLATTRCHDSTVDRRAAVARSRTQR
jgi:hypothetical protein